MSGSSVGGGSVGRNCGYGMDGEREGSAGQPGQTQLLTTNVNKVCLSLQHSVKATPSFAKLPKGFTKQVETVAVNFSNLRKICLQVCDEHFYYLPTPLSGGN